MKKVNYKLLKYLTNEFDVFEPILESQEIDIITSPFEVNSNQNQDLEPVVPSEP